MATLAGGATADNLVGDVGAIGDLLFGHGGDDTLRGLTSVDTLIGGDGSDRIEGGLGFDRLSGGAGNDTFVFASRLDMAADRIGDFQRGDAIDLTGLGAFAWLQDFAFSGAGNEVRYRSTTIDGGAWATEVLFDLDGDTIADGNIILIGHHRLQMATPGILTAVQNQALNGDGAANLLAGDVGHDTLRGLGGADSLVGGNGNDRLLGGNGADTLLGGNGADTLTGGEGSDVFLFTTIQHLSADQIRDFAAGDIIDLATGLAGWTFIGDAAFTGMAATIRYEAGQFFFDTEGDGLGDRSMSLGTLGSGSLPAIEETSRGSLQFRIATAAVLAGTDGNDTLAGGGAADFIAGLGGADRLFGGANRDTLSGGAGTDTMFGEGGADSLSGGEGADILLGGHGADTLVGGTGADVFRVLSGFDIGQPAGPPTGSAVSASVYDVILDFTAEDRLDLKALGRISINPDGIFEGLAGEAVVLYGTAGPLSITLSIDIDGNGQADGGVLFQNVNGLLAETAPGSGMFQLVPPVNRAGGAGADSLAGAGAGDSLSGLGGADTLSGLAGADTLLGGDDGDLLLGGAGNDSMVGGAGGDTLVGGTGADTADMGAGDDVLRFNSLAELGPKAVIGFGAGDRIDLAGIGAFTWLNTGAFVVGGGLQVRFSLSFNTIEIDTDGSGFSDSSIFLSSFSGPLDLTAPGSRVLELAAPRNVLGGPGADSLTGAGAGDTISGLGGADTLSGLGGADTLLGGDDGDLLFGSAGNDSLNGEAGNDTLVGGAGGDTIAMGAGDDVLRFDSALETGYDSVIGFGLGDRIDLTGIGAFTWLGTGAFAAGSWPQVRFNGTSVEVDLTGDGFVDVGIILGGFGGAIDLTTPGSRVLEVAIPRNVTGDVGPDSLVGGAAADTISGLAGADTLSGLGGADTLLGDDAGDLLLGGEGNDSLIGGAGNDTLVGGAGRDSADMSAGDDVLRFDSLADTGSDSLSQGERVSGFGLGDRIDLTGIGAFTWLGSGAFAAGNGQEVRFGPSPYTFSGYDIEIDSDGNGSADRRISFLDFAGTLVLDAPGSRILRVDGPQAPFGASSLRLLPEGTLAETLSGSGGADTLRGRDGADRLDGGGANDRLDGGVGADTLIGGTGADTLTGGAGSDRFVFGDNASKRGAAADIVTDFSAAGGDRIDLSGMDADLDLAGKQDFTFVTGGFTGVGQLRFKEGVLYANTSGTVAPEWQIGLTGVASLSAGDLVLV